MHSNQFFPSYIIKIRILFLNSVQYVLNLMHSASAVWTNLDRNSIWSELREYMNQIHRFCQWRSLVENADFGDQQNYCFNRLLLSRKKSCKILISALPFCVVKNEEKKINKINKMIRESTWLRV